MRTRGTRLRISEAIDEGARMCRDGVVQRSLCRLVLFSKAKAVGRAIEGHIPPHECPPPLLELVPVYLPPVLAVLHFLFVFFLCSWQRRWTCSSHAGTPASKAARLCSAGNKTCRAHAVTSGFKCGIRAAMGGAATFVIIFVAVVHVHCARPERL